MIHSDTQALITDVLNRYREYLAKSESGRKGRMTRLIAKAADLNDGVEPTLGADWRLHAPCDHYNWVWYVEDPTGADVAEYHKVAMGGEYLPTGEPKPSAGGSNTSRITYVPAELAQEIVGGLQQELPVGHGSVFDGRDGQVCHLYLDTVCKDVVTMIEDYIEAPKRAAEAQRIAIEQAEYEAAEDAPEGRVEVSGEILRTRAEDGYYSYHSVVVKMLVLDDRGFKVWGTKPDSLNEAGKGSHVTFTATLTVSQDDPKFAFFKRPSKASFTHEEEAA